MVRIAKNKIQAVRGGLIPTIVLFIILVTFSGCISLPRWERAPGSNYFKSDFECRKGLIAYENWIDKDEKYREIQGIYAKDSQKRNGARVALTGDSTAMLFFQPKLNAFVPGVDIVNRGIGGDTTHLLLRRIKADVLLLKPELIFIAIGGNDLLLGRCIPDILANTDNLLKLIETELPGSRVVLVSVPPVSTWKANSIVPFYNRRLEYLTAEYERVDFMDLWPHLARPDTPRLKEEFRIKLGLGLYDRVHFNESAYKIWGRLISEFVEKFEAESKPVVPENVER